MRAVASSAGDCRIDDRCRASGVGAPAGVHITEQDVRDRLRAVLGGVPYFDERAEMAVGCVAGDGSAVEVDSDERLTGQGELGDQLLLARWQVDVCGIDPLRPSTRWTRCRGLPPSVRMTTSASRREGDGSSVTGVVVAGDRIAAAVTGLPVLVTESGVATSDDARTVTEPGLVGSRRQLSGLLMVEHDDFLSVAVGLHAPIRWA